MFNNIINLAIIWVLTLPSSHFLEAKQKACNDINNGRFLTGNVAATFIWYTEPH